MPKHILKNLSVKFKANTQSRTGTDCSVFNHMLLMSATLFEPKSRRITGLRDNDYNRINCLSAQQLIEQTVHKLHVLERKYC